MNKFKIIAIALVATLIFGKVLFGCERIDAGHAGVKVELYGSERGVQDVELVTGMVWYNRFTTDVYEFPTYVKEIKYQRVIEDGSEVSDRSIHCTTVGTWISLHLCEERIQRCCRSNDSRTHHIEQEGIRGFR